MGEHDHARTRAHATPDADRDAASHERLPRRTGGAPPPGGGGVPAGGDAHGAFAAAVNAGIHDDVAAVTRVSHRTEEFPLDQTLDERGIAARTSRGGGFNWGLTEARPSVHATSRVGPAPGGAGYGVTQLAVELAYADRRKFITRNAPAGGRRFALIDAHESRHVADFQARLAAEDAQLPQRVAQTALPTIARPLAAADQAAAEATINPRIEAAVRTAVAAFRRELDAAQDHIDRPDADTARALRDLALLDPELMRGDFADGQPSPAVGYAPTPGALFVNGVRAQDVVQGQLADCYLAAALAALAGSQPELVRSMIQPAGGHDYRVRLFQWEGERRIERHVVVDDYLPQTARGTPGYMRSSEAAPGGGRELWPLLVEKAYAQVHGGYDDIGDGGHASHALSVLTGARPTELPAAGGRDGSRYQQVVEAVRGRQPVVMTTRRDFSHEETLRVGLYPWHSYPVIGVDPGARTVRLRNVWGTRFQREDVAAATANGLDDAPEFTVTVEVFERYASGVATT